jgi:hypothetical protein
LIEIMVTVGLLSFIILGLLAMFQQTQRAFRSSMTQTDVLEAGRSVVEMIRGEIEQAAPTHYQGRSDLGVNFFTEISTNYSSPLIQELPGLNLPRPFRTNIVHRFFFLTRQNQDWIGTGYQVLFDDQNGYVGTLYRFSMTNPFRGGPFVLADNPMANNNRIWTNIAGMSRIMDGVVHLRVRSFAANGFPIYGDGYSPNVYFRTNTFYTDFKVVRDARAYQGPPAPMSDGFAGCYFYRDSMPASVELELGILEPRVNQRYRAMPTFPAAAAQSGTRYLAGHAAQVHVFRQRIPLRNADLSVYP